MMETHARWTLPPLEKYVPFPPDLAAKVAAHLVLNADIFPKLPYNASKPSGRETSLWSQIRDWFCAMDHNLLLAEFQHEAKKLGLTAHNAVFITQAERGINIFCNVEASEERLAIEKGLV